MVTRDIAGVRQAAAENHQIGELLGGSGVSARAEAQGCASQKLSHDVSPIFRAFIGKILACRLLALQRFYW